jgi:hypothetical protein
MLDRDVLARAFDLLGSDLARRGLFVEIAVYGGSALMLQFAWRRGTEDVDAVVREGSDDRALRPSVAFVAERMGLSPDWLNNAVGMFTPLDEDDSLFQSCGTYPAGSRPGLRVLLARPAYLLAMKLKALSSLDRGDRDLADARALATHLGIAGEDALRTLYVAIHGEEPGRELLRRFPSVLSGGGR